MLLQEKRREELKVDNQRFSQKYAGLRAELYPAGILCPSSWKFSPPQFGRRQRWSSWSLCVCLLCVCVSFNFELWVIRQVEKRDPRVLESENAAAQHSRIQDLCLSCRQSQIWPDAGAITAALGSWRVIGFRSITSTPFQHSLASITGCFNGGPKVVR